MLSPSLEGCQGFFRVMTAKDSRARAERVGACAALCFVLAWEMRLFLAPMQDVTDVAMMRTLARVGSLPDCFMTPYFRSTASTCAMAEANLRCIEQNETGVPVVAQLAGSEVEPLVRDARALMRLPVAGVNLNAGCPSPLVNRHGAGAALLRRPERFRAILLALRDLLPPGAFSVKCRLGWEDARAEFPRLLELLDEAQPDFVMVHARTRRQLYGGVPDEAALALAVRSLRCPVFGNGDVRTLPQAQRWLAELCPAGLAIGRGAVRNPFLFRMLRGAPAPSPEELRQYYHVLAEETERVLPPRRSPAAHCNRMKKYLAFCYDDFSPEQEYALRRCTQMDEMLRILDER